MVLCICGVLQRGVLSVPSMVSFHVHSEVQWVGVECGYRRPSRLGCTDYGCRSCDYREAGEYATHFPPLPFLPLLPSFMTPLPSWARRTTSTHLGCPQTSIATSILGGLSTLAASYLAKSRGSNEPEESTRKAQDLKSFIRDCEAFKLDCGHMYGQSQDHMINRYRRRFEEILGNGVEGVGDDVKVNKVQKEKATHDSAA